MSIVLFFFWLSLSMINLLISALCHAGNILKLIGSFLTVIANYMIRGTNSLSPTQPDRTISETAIQYQRIYKLQICLSYEHFN